MKLILKTVLALFFLIAPAISQTKQILYCTSQLATALVKVDRAWRTGPLGTERWTIELSHGAHRLKANFITTEGGFWPCRRDHAFEYTSICIGEHGSTFMYSLDTQRFIFSWLDPLGYTHRDYDEVSILYAGKCEKF